MRIGINTLFEDPTIGTGGLTYIRNLVHALSKVDGSHEYVLFVSPLNKHLFETEAANFSLVLCPCSKERRFATVLFEHTRLPMLIRKHRLDVFHSPGNIAPVWIPAASVVTLHTIHHYIVPHLIARSSMVYRRALMPGTVRRADSIITISDFVRTNLKTLLNVPDDRMITVYEGVESSFANGHHAPNPPQLPARFLLWVSALWRYKNAETLLRAFQLLKSNDRIEHKLVIVGDGWIDYRRELEQLARDLGVAPDVVFTGRVPDVLPYYSAADAFICPSLHEEFGLPVLEAMAAGAPVIVSDRGSLPEIAGDAALIVDPESPSQIAQAVRRALTDKTMRLDLIARGRKRAATFTWEKTAQGTLAAYSHAFSRRTHASRQ
jgi:glycosyltransferase involved in cell wall biosynthesis